MVPGHEVRSPALSLALCSANETHSTALPIDAALFAHLHAFLALPSLKTDSPKTTNRLRAAVERHEQLCQWTRRLDRRYFDG